MSKKTLIILSLVLVLAGLGNAQNITGSLSGRVVDGQGSAVANAAVTVTEVQRNVKSETKSNVAGDFTIAGLPPGNYSLTVEAPGFKKLSRAAFPRSAA